VNNPGFIDQNRPVQQKYYELLDRMDQESMSQQKKIKLMRRLIDQDLHFLDPYLYLHEIYQYENKPKKANKILVEAFDHAIDLVTNKKGEWPEALYWGWIENRHIIRTILNKALTEWDQANNEQAIKLLRKLFKTNPQDNIGARHYILGIRLGFTLVGFEDRFNKGGYYNNDLNEWFDEHAPKFPKEFDWWFKEMESQGL
jgi:tetratricopeptide (TPR) repeat protein